MWRIYTQEDDAFGWPILRCYTPLLALAARLSKALDDSRQLLHVVLGAVYSLHAPAVLKYVRCAYWDPVEALFFLEVGVNDHGFLPR